MPCASGDVPLAVDRWGKGGYETGTQDRHREPNSRPAPQHELYTRGKHGDSRRRQCRSKTTWSHVFLAQNGLLQPYRAAEGMMVARALGPGTRVAAKHVWPSAG
jgi:hypothetical protein